MWQVGLKARGVALSLVCLTCIFIVLWVALGPGLHKNYETPTPVRNSPLFFSIVSSLPTLRSVLVLDQPPVLGRTPWWRIYSDVDCTICFRNTVHSTVFLGGGLLVGR